MPAALKWKKTALLFKTEVTYALDPVPTGAANAILATDVKLQPMEGTDVDRDLDLPYFGTQGTIPNELHAKLSFKVELSPSGTAGTAPAWAPLLRACGVAQVVSAGVSVTYNPITDNHESGTFYLHKDGTRYMMRGARGNAKMMVNAQGIPYLEFAFTGLFSQPSDQTFPTPVLTAFKAPQVASSTNTPTFMINSVPLVMRSFTLDMKNQVENRFLIGAEAILITDRADMIETVVEAQLLAAFNPFSLAAAQTTVPISLVHGVGAGKITTLAVPAAQMMRPQGLEQNQNIVEWPLSLAALPVAGNDQWTLTLT